MMLGVVAWALVFVVSLSVLVKASDVFTSSAEKIGLYYGVPAFIVGVTVVSMGTSLPELVSSVMAVLEGSSEIVAGTVVGSNITNVFLILGVAAVLTRKMDVTFEVIHVDLPLLVGSAFLLALAAADGEFTKAEAFISLGGALAYISYALAVEKKDKSLEVKELEKEARRVSISQGTWAALGFSTVFIYAGAKYTIDSIIALSDLLGIGKDVLASSIIALGTGLPELAVTYSAAKKGKAEMALGNILGSNVFNAFLVMGTAGLLGTLTVAATTVSVGLPIMIAATLLAFFIIQDKQVTLWEGWMLLLFYVFYLGKMLAIF